MFFCVKVCRWTTNMKSYPHISVATSRSILISSCLTDRSTVESATAVTGLQPAKLPCVGLYEKHGVWRRGGHKTELFQRIISAARLFNNDEILSVVARLVINGVSVSTQIDGRCSEQFLTMQTMQCDIFTSFFIVLYCAMDFSPWIRSSSHATFQIPIHS